MTDRNLSELIIILDRSGSMCTIKSDMEGGFRTFIQDRQRDPTRVLVSLYQFDDTYEAVYEERSVHDVRSLALEPRGSTALLDAVGRTINRVGDRLRRKSEHARPGAVVVMIITDGQENASREFRSDQVRALIEHQEQHYNWKFMYLGADANAFAEAAALGINVQRSAKYTHDALGTQALFNASSSGIGEYYAGVQRGVVGADLSLQGQDGFTVGPDNEIDVTSSVKP
jgi:uncharacterized protein YegL